MDTGLKGKVAIISGVNNPQGIGAATALALAREGVRLALVYKRIDHAYQQDKTGADGYDRYFKANSGDALKTEQALRALGAEYFIMEGDISREADVDAVFDRAVERFSGVDILVNNAAYSDDLDTIETVTSGAIDATFSANLRGTILMTRAFVKRRGAYGRVVNLSTDAAQVFAGQIAYGASKAAIEALTRSIAMEVGRYGITVNCVAPGPTQTGWIDADLERKVVSDIPMGALIAPEDIANAIVFLCARQARYITGQVIKVSGGHNL